MIERVVPLWAINEKKYERAVLELRKAGLEVTDEAAKVLYVKYGGLLAEAEVSTPSVENALSEGVEAPAPRRGRRKTE